MNLQEIILEKLTDYTEKYGLEVGFDLLLLELGVEVWEALVLLSTNELFN